MDDAAGLIELRLPWDLLNVSDPSSRTLLYEKRVEDDFGTVRAGPFHFLAVALDSANGVTDTLGPSAGWRWEEWEEPVWFARPKPAYDSLSATWGTLP